MSSLTGTVTIVTQLWALCSSLGLLPVLVCADREHYVYLNSTVPRGGVCPGVSNATYIYTCETNGPILTWFVDPYLPIGAGSASFTSTNHPGDTIPTDQDVAKPYILQTTPTLISTLVFNPPGDLESDVIILCQTTDGKNSMQTYISSEPPRQPTNLNVSLTYIHDPSGFIISMSWDEPINDISHHHVQVILSYSNGTTNVSRLREVKENFITVFELYDQQMDFVMVEASTVNKCNQRSKASVFQSNLQSPVPKEKCASITNGSVYNGAAVSAVLGAILSIIGHTAILWITLLFIFKIVIKRRQNRVPTIVNTDEVATDSNILNAMNNRDDTGTNQSQQPYTQNVNYADKEQQYHKQMKLDKDLSLQLHVPQVGNSSAQPHEENGNHEEPSGV